MSVLMECCSDVFWIGGNSERWAVGCRWRKSSAQAAGQPHPPAPSTRPPAFLCRMTQPPTCRWSRATHWCPWSSSLRPSFRCCVAMLKTPLTTRCVCRGWVVGVNREGKGWSSRPFSVRCRPAADAPLCNVRRFFPILRACPLSACTLIPHATRSMSSSRSLHPLFDPFATLSCPSLRPSTSLLIAAGHRVLHHRPPHTVHGGADRCRGAACSGDPLPQEPGGWLRVVVVAPLYRK